VDVARVLVDARVVDDSAKPITGLTATDFAVHIGSKAVAVDAVDWVSTDARQGRAETSQTLPISTPAPQDRWSVFPPSKETRFVGGRRPDAPPAPLATLANVVADADHVAVVSFGSRLSSRGTATAPRAQLSRRSVEAHMFAPLARSISAKSVNPCANARSTTERPFSSRALRFAP